MHDVTYYADIQQIWLLYGDLFKRSRGGIICIICPTRPCALDVRCLVRDCVTSRSSQWIVLILAEIAVCAARRCCTADIISVLTINVCIAALLDLPCYSRRPPAFPYPPLLDVFSRRSWLDHDSSFGQTRPLGIICIITPTQLLCDILYFFVSQIDDERIK